MKLFLLAAIINVVQGVITVGPVNTAVIAGSTATFECVTRNPSATVRWNYESVVLYNGYRVNHRVFDERFSVTDNKITGQRKLTIDNVQLKDSGVYSCYELNDFLKQRQADLVILESGPTCSTNVTLQHQPIEEFQTLQITCNVTYRGKWKPVFKCLPETPGQVVTADVAATSPHIGYVLRITASSRIHQKIVSCQMDFVDTTSSMTSEAPVYAFSWSSPLISVTYGPTLPRIDRANNSVVKHGEVLKCRAESNPVPSYVWKEFPSGDILHHGENYVVDACKLLEFHQPSQSGTTDVKTLNVLLQCIATRHARHAATGVAFRVTLDSVPRICNSGSQATAAWYYVFLAICSLLMFSSIVIISIIVIKCLQRRGESTVEENMPDVVPPERDDDSTNDNESDDEGEHPAAAVAVVQQAPSHQHLEVNNVGVSRSLNNIVDNRPGQQPPVYGNITNETVQRRGREHQGAPNI